MLASPNTRHPRVAPPSWRMWRLHLPLGLCWQSPVRADIGQNRLIVESRFAQMEMGIPLTGASVFPRSLRLKTSCPSTTTPPLSCLLVSRRRQEGTPCMQTRPSTWSVLAVLHVCAPLFSNLSLHFLLVVLDPRDGHDTLMTANICLAFMSQPLARALST